MPAPSGVILQPKVTYRQYSLQALVVDAWGAEYAAPDHGIYCFSDGRKFDSTDKGTTGFYRPP